MSTFGSLWSRLRARWTDLARPHRDLIAIAVVSIPVYLLLLWLDAADYVHHWSDVHEEYEVDELIALFFFIGMAAIVFSLRRLFDLRREIAERQKTEREAHRLARHDALTGLPNRRRFLEEFHRLTEHMPDGHVCAMFVIDLDLFKPINDLYGHRLGDEVLRVIAKRLSELVADPELMTQDEGIVARLGGDEFGILVRTPRDAGRTLRLARRIVHDVPQPIQLAALSLEVGVSVGISVYDPGEETESKFGQQEHLVDIKLRQADMAMYRAKNESRGDYRFFDRAMDEKLQLRVQLEREIKGAIARGEIVPYYQPLVDLTDGRVIGYEMLARWHHPTKGLILPDVFIPSPKTPAPSASLLSASCGRRCATRATIRRTPSCP